MNLNAIYTTITRAYSGRRAKEITGRLHAHNRLITNPAYEQGARFCRDLMTTMGFDDVEFQKFPIDGKRLYGNWLTPRAWDIRKAWLKLKIGGTWSAVADYAETPTSIFVYTAPTHGEIETELVDIHNENIAGKLVFCDPTPGHRLLMQRKGALGIATGFSENWKGVRSNRDCRQARRWNNDFLFEDRTSLVGFSLSRTQAAGIQKELKKRGAIPCKFTVDGHLGKGDFCCATGCIRGTEKPREEVVAVAHLYEVGANDNASGVAGAIEALHTIRSLVHKKLLPPPRRTIRVIFAFEIVGFLAYFSHVRKQKRKYVAGINPDMIGENQRTCRSILHIFQCPDSLATFANPLIIDFVKKAAGRRLQTTVRSFIVNDNIVSDPVLGIPCPALIHYRDKYYHSNEDTLDKVSSLTLKKVGGAMAAYLYACAALDKELAPDVAQTCLDYSRARIRREERSGCDRKKLAYIVERETERLKSIEKLAGTSLVTERKALLAAARQVKTGAPRREQLDPELVGKAKRMIPSRKVWGTFTLQHIPLEQRRSLPFQPAWSPKAHLPVFWINGKRNLLTIYEKTSCESRAYSLKQLMDYFVFLEQEKLIRIKRAP